MRSRWKKGSLKLRLALWHAAATALVLAVFAGVVYRIVGHRLAAELDRQLRIDFDLVEAQLESDEAGQIRWQVKGAHGEEGFVRLAAWFEVWSEEGELRFRHWPVPEADIRSPLPAPLGAALRFHTVELEPNLYVRLMERPARVGALGVMLRLFRDETDLRHTLGEIVEVFALAAPLAVLLASIGGYVVARRSLRPVAAMAEKARKITSESLGERLPNPNPEDELGQLAAVFNQTLERLASSFAELKRFTADASHELRTPLTALRAVGEVALRQTKDPSLLRETIGSMLEEAERLRDLVESLLALARMESGKVAGGLEPTSLADVASEVRDSLQVLAAEKQQRIELIGQDVRGLANRPLLRQALMNLVHNAVRYAPAGTQITIRTACRDGRVLIEIEDHGRGIAPEHQARVFDRFYRVDKARDRGEGGHGLGLSIAREAIEHQGGQMELRSERGKGSIFSVLLPAIREIRPGD